jgi:integrase/recombinase XerD
MSTAPSFPSLVQDFFCQRLVAQRNATATTVASYRDTFRLFLRYMQASVGKPPTALSLTDVDAPHVLGFLDHLEKERGNSIRSRNARLAALRSFVQYVALRDPASLPALQRILAIPMKRFNRPLLGFLSDDEIEAILAAPDASTWSGHRDQVMFATFYNTGARVSEVIGLRRADVQLQHRPCLCLHGKGRKDRTVPLWRSTAAALRDWMARSDDKPLAPLFPNRDGSPLSRSGVRKRLHVAVAAAAARCPTLADRAISPHTLRHTTAMHLLQAGVDTGTIAMWLGHESPVTTHLYVEADLAMKERALRKVPEPAGRRARFRPSDRLLAFLEAL